jgi:hypothetical protein
MRETTSDVLLKGGPFLVRQVVDERPVPVRSPDPTFVVEPVFSV